MPWKVTSLMEQRLSFITALQKEDERFRAVCARFGISRTTGYTWVQRYERDGLGGLRDRSRAPHAPPHRTPATLVAALIELRQAHPLWGPKKLRALLREQHPSARLPAASTLGDLLKQHGLIRPRRRRFRTPLGPQPLSPCHDPNALGCIDFKGHFALGDGTRCYPLTVTDAFSRYLLLCEAVSEQDERTVRVVLERLFRAFGLPDRIRSDNGPPFASTGLGGLTDLSVWWGKLGIVHERIEPGHPEQNGRHERMHRTLKDACASPPPPDAVAQHLAFARFRAEFNELRPHEALGQRPPVTAYAVSRRVFPETLGSPTYDATYEVRPLDARGRLCIGGKKLPVARCLRGERVGLRAVTDTQWQLYWWNIYLGVVDLTPGAAKVLRAP